MPFSTVTIYGQHFILGTGLALSGNSVLGTGNLSGQWLDGTPWATNILQNDAGATILVVSGGDANEDGVVDAADFIAIKQNFGMTGGALWSDGNFTVNTVGEGAVDWADLQILMGNFGTTASGAVPAPEPATLSLLALLALSLPKRGGRSFPGPFQRLFLASYSASTRIV